MTHTCCPGCRLRISRAAATSLAACPNCGEALSTGSAEQVFGFPLWDPASAPLAFDDILAVAAEMALPSPERP